MKEKYNDKTISIPLMGTWDFISAKDDLNNTTYFSYAEESFSNDGLFSDALSTLQDYYNKTIFIFSSISEDLEELNFSNIIEYDTEKNLMHINFVKKFKTNYIFFHLKENFNDDNLLANHINITNILNGETSQIDLEGFINNNENLSLYLKFDKQGNFIEALETDIDYSFKNNIVNIEGNNIEF